MNFIAIDLGTTNGRVILGTFEKGTLKMDEVHRFSNDMLFYDGHYRWNIYLIFENIIFGLKNVLKEIFIYPR